LPWHQSRFFFDSTRYLADGSSRNQRIALTANVTKTGSLTLTCTGTSL
jgi:hypothetical protein